ncbi:MAG: S26 family signal peptidase, partial [Butyricicoccus sp.]
MNQEAASERNEEQQGRFSSSLFDWSESIMFSLILVVVIFTFLFRMIAVDGRSMEPTLLDHDMM